MKRVIAAAAIVLGFTFTSSAIGQDATVKTKTSPDTSIIIPVGVGSLDSRACARDRAEKIL